MEINLECSGKYTHTLSLPDNHGDFLLDIFNDEYSQFMDNNSQICLNEEE